MCGRVHVWNLVPVSKCKGREPRSLVRRGIRDKGHAQLEELGAIDGRDVLLPRRVPVLEVDRPRPTGLLTVEINVGRVADDGVRIRCPDAGDRGASIIDDDLSAAGKILGRGLNDRGLVVRVAEPRVKPDRMTPADAGHEVDLANIEAVVDAWS